MPLANIVLLTADGLDALVSLVEAGKWTIPEFVLEMKRRALSDNPSDMIFTAEQLPELNQTIAPPSYLQKAQSEWKNGVLRRYQ